MLWIIPPFPIKHQKDDNDYDDDDDDDYLEVWSNVGVGGNMSKQQETTHLGMVYTCLYHLFTVILGIVYYCFNFASICQNMSVRQCQNTCQNR